MARRASSILKRKLGTETSLHEEGNRFRFILDLHEQNIKALNEEIGRDTEQPVTRCAARAQGAWTSNPAICTPAPGQMFEPRFGRAVIGRCGQGMRRTKVCRAVQAHHRLTPAFARRHQREA